MVKLYNDIYRVQMPNITPHVCRHTYCSNMAKSGMNPKTLQYLIKRYRRIVSLEAVWRWQGDGWGVFVMEMRRK